MKLNKLFLAAALLVTGSLVSCGGNKAPAKFTTGVGYAGKLEAKKDGVSQLDLTGAFASFDKDGKILDARLDVVQVKAKASDDKKTLVLANTNVVDGSVTSKLELGDDYKMVQFGGAIAEVDYQIEAFADWTVGKTVAEVKASVNPEHGHGTAPHADLATTCTIDCNAFIEALEVAYQNRSAAEYDVVDGAKAGIGMKANIAMSHGKPTSDFDVVIGGTMAKDGKIVASSFDHVVFPTKIAEDGAISENKESNYLKDGLKSKYTLKSDYNMKPASPIEKEWFEQADFLNAAIVGKTATEIVALNGGDETLTGATMYCGTYLSAIAEAVNYAPLARVAAGK